MWTSNFWKQAGERALKTFAQTLIAAGLVVGVAGWDEWQAALIAAGIAALLSLFTSAASAEIGDKGTPSLVSETLEPADVVALPDDLGGLDEPPVGPTGGAYNDLEAATDPANIVTPK